MLAFGSEYQLRPYKPYKNKQFAKKLDKMRALINSVNETSLKDSDKKILLEKFKEMLT